MSDRSRGLSPVVPSPVVPLTQENAHTRLAPATLDARADAINLASVTTGDYHSTDLKKKDLALQSVRSSAAVGTDAAARLKWKALAL